MLIDAFLAHNEHEIFKLRTEILQDDVDCFLLVEGDVTHRGAARTPFFYGNQTMLSDRVWLKTFTATLPKDVESPWQRENAHRNAIKDALELLCDPHDNDVIMISDIDEIPDPGCLTEAVYRARAGQIVALKQIHTYYALNLYDEEPWYGTRVLTWKKLKTMAPQDIRGVASKDAGEVQYEIEQGGWHFGWTGDNAQLRAKLSSFAHDELDQDDLKSEAYLDHCRNQRRTLHNNHKLKLLPTDRLPDVVRLNQDRYKNMLVQEL